MEKSIYTDLAVEARELHPEFEGVTEQKNVFGDVTVTTICIHTREAAQQLNKACGKYVTLDAPRLLLRPPELMEEVSRILAREIQRLIPQNSRERETLIIGLGNRSVTPDSLGPRVAERVYVTRHILQYMPEILSGKPRSVASFAPGVLGTTGVETLEVVQGMVERVKPGLVIAVDALASRRAHRISTAIQLTDTGIRPGAGVDNLRSGIDEETLGVPVIALGVPMVVYASTIFEDVLEAISQKAGSWVRQKELIQLGREVISEEFGPMIVTPKDVDSILSDMSGVLADGINRALMDSHYEELRMLLQ